MHTESTQMVGCSIGHNPPNSPKWYQVGHDTSLKIKANVYYSFQLASHVNAFKSCIFFNQESNLSILSYIPKVDYFIVKGI